jgi:phospholipid/cholesterol/gamma-HCH transport system substrate-binding protein
MLVKKDVKQFIRTDCEVAIGSEGLIGDKLLIITQGSSDAPLVKEGQRLASAEPVELDAIMASLQVTAGNAEIISDQLAEIMIKVNGGQGTIGRLIQDSTIADNLSETMVNIRSSSKGLDENMNAAKENFLLRGYFRRQAEAKAEADEKTRKEAKKMKKEADKKKKADDKKKAAEQKTIEKEKK